jgi:hypothetical protein
MWPSAIGSVRSSRLAQVSASSGTDITANWGNWKNNILAGFLCSKSQWKAKIDGVIDEWNQESEALHHGRMRGELGGW